MTPALAAEYPGVAGQTDLSGDGTELDDPAIAVLQHRRQERSGDPEGSVEVDVDHSEPLFLAGFGEERRQPDAGVVDEDIHPAEIGQHLFRHRLYALRSLHVEGVGAGVSTLLPECGGDGFGLVRRKVGQCDGNTLRTEFFCKGAADSAGGTGNNGNPMIELHGMLLLDVCRIFQLQKVSMCQGMLAATVFIDRTEGWVKEAPSS